MLGFHALTIAHGRRILCVVLWLSAALIAMVSNLDNFAAGVAFGMRGTRIPCTPNAIIAVVTMAGTASALTFGRALSSVLSPALSSAVGSSIIIAIGGWSVVVSLRAVRMRAGARESGSRGLSVGCDRPRGDLKGSEIISCRGALALGVALSLNNVGTGVGAGVAGISPLTTTVLAGAFSLIFISGGSSIGSSVGSLVVGRWASLISGIILLSVGGAALSGIG